MYMIIVCKTTTDKLSQYTELRLKCIHLFTATTLPVLWNSLTFTWLLKAILPVLELSVSCMLTKYDSTQCIIMQNNAVQNAPYQLLFYCFATKHWCCLKHKSRQETVFLWQDFFLTIPTFCQLPDSSLSDVKFPQISRFSRQVVTLFVKQRTHTFQFQYC